MTSTSIIYRNHIEEITSLKGQNKYCEEMIIEANACGEKSAAKEYQQVIKGNNERLSVLESLVNNGSLWN